MHLECCLKKVFEQEGLTFEGVAAVTDINEEHLERIDNSEFQALRSRTLVAICEVAHCQISDFIKVVPD